MYSNTFIASRYCSYRPDRAKSLERSLLELRLNENRCSISFTPTSRPRVYGKTKGLLFISVIPRLIDGETLYIVRIHVYARRIKERKRTVVHVCDVLARKSCKPIAVDLLIRTAGRRTAPLERHNRSNIDHVAARTSERVQLHGVIYSVARSGIYLVVVRIEAVDAGRRKIVYRRRFPRIIPAEIYGVKPCRRVVYSAVVRRLADLHYPAVLEQPAFPQPEPLALPAAGNIPLAEKHDMIETRHIHLILGVVYKLLPFRNVREVRLQIPVVEFLQIVKAKRRQLLLQSRQMVFPQVLIVYGRKLRLHRVQYLAPVVRPILAPVEEVRPVVVVGRKPVIVIGK